MHLITSAQCRAARALLNWSQPDLAKRCGIHVQTISNFEQDTGSPTKNTLTVIAETLKNAGVVLTDEGGVNPNKSGIVIYEGREGFEAFMTDVMESAKIHPNFEMCISNVNEEDWEANLSHEFAENYRAEMRRVEGLQSRILVKEADNFHTARDFAQYRAVPSSVFSQQASFYAYGDNLALITFHNKSVQVVVLKNRQFTDSFKVMFNAVWKNYKVIK